MDPTINPVPLTNQKPLVSLILPCLNEEKAIIFCLEEINNMLTRCPWPVEVLIVDNGSTDDSVALALNYKNSNAAHPALSDLTPDNLTPADSPPDNLTPDNLPVLNLKLLKEERAGYGFALLKGLQNASGDYLFLADADGTYDFSAVPLFIAELQTGADLVIGNRFAGTIAKNAMPSLHRYFGNPFLSFLVRRFFKVKIKDIHCGARALTRAALEKLNLKTGGMEFASEMIIKAAKQKLTIKEIPVNYRCRLGESKLHSWADGWRHLRFILLYSPLILFFLPGGILFGAGAILMTALYFRGLHIGGVPLYAYPMFLFSVMIILGYQLMIFGGFSKVYAVTHLGDSDRLVEKLFRHITIEKTGLAGLLIAVAGAIIYLTIFLNWLNSGFSSLSEIKNSLVAVTLLILGMQTFFSAFMFSMLGIKEK